LKWLRLPTGQKPDETLFETVFAPINLLSRLLSISLLENEDVKLLQFQKLTNKEILYPNGGKNPLMGASLLARPYVWQYPLVRKPKM
jgi:hypothetical protein